MKHFTEADDIVLLKELLATPPCQVDHGEAKVLWGRVAGKVSQVIGREVTSRALQDRFTALAKKAKKDDTTSLAASGISEELSERNRLVLEYLELADLPKPVKARPSLEGLSVKDLALKRLKEKSELSETNGSEQGSMEPRPLPPKRGKEAKFLEALSEQVAASRISLEEDVEVKKSQA
jgi:hypothetical protein